MLWARCLTVIGAVLMLSVAGCPGSSADVPDLATVSGTVTMGGEPLGGALVEFMSAGGQIGSAVTDASGKYELAYKGDTKGAEIGENTVRITTVLDHPTPPDYVDPIPAKYNEATELKVTVATGANTHNFDLEP